MFRILKASGTGIMTVNDLSNEMNISYQQGYNICRELLADLETMSDLPIKTIRKQLMQLRNFDISVDEYRLHLLEDAIQFQFLDYLVQGNIPSVDRFCQERFISRSTLLRKTVPLRDLLAKYHLKLSLTKAEIQGDEKQVRLFLFAFYWLGFHGVAWPIKSLQLERVAAQYEKLTNIRTNPIEVIQDELFWAICRLRIARGKVINSFSRFTKLFKGFAPFDEPIYDQSSFPSLSPRTLQAESAFFHFQQNRDINFTNLKPIEAQLYQYFVSTDTIIHHYVAHFINYLKPYYNDDARPLIEDRLLVVNLAKVFLNFFLMQDDQVKLIDFYSPQRLEYEQAKLLTYIMQFTATLPDDSEYQVLRDNSDSLTHILYYLLVPYLRQFKWDEAVNVKMLIGFTDLVSYNMLLFLRDINIVNILPDEAPIEAADLIITSMDDLDEFNEYNPDVADDQAVLNWNIDSTETDFYNLYIRIKHIFLNKVIEVPVSKEA
ncbi:helix-turn-helix domain-containing protein [Lacticaseibacillus saniviri]